MKKVIIAAVFMVAGATFANAQTVKEKTEVKTDTAVGKILKGEAETEVKADSAKSENKLEIKADTATPAATSTQTEVKAEATQKEQPADKPKTKVE